jgi:drug/metabolite transporter (DMT)-like permease
VNLIPVFTVLLGWLILGEQFTPTQYLAALLILTGIFLSQDRPVRAFRPRTLRNQSA